MKHIIPFILFVLLSITGFAQSHRFADTTAQWYMGRADNPIWCNGCYSYSTEHFTITGDTAVANRTYQKLGTISTPVLLRDSAHRVYRYYEDREVIVYDFNYAAGDTFSLGNLFANASMNVFCHVDSVDTVHLLYPRKRMYLTYNNQSFFQDIWIEGIGSLNSNFLSPALELMGFDMPSYHTRCFIEDDSLLVHTDSVNTVCLFDTFAPASPPAYWFADSTAQWNILTHQYGWFPSTPETYQTTERKVVGDTTIGGILYQNIDNTYYIRRAPDQKIYTLFASQEVKLYDFGAAVGDTIEDLSRSFVSSNANCIVDSVDTVNWLKPRKRMHLTCYLSNSEGMVYADEWVDGIGSLKYNSISGYVYSTVVDGWEETLLCFFENDQPAFHDTRFDTCYYQLNVGIDEVVSLSYSIYPNPSSSSITITLSQQPEPNTDILIYNTIGALVKQEDLTTSTQQINVAELPNGMYTYAITHQGLRQTSGKLIISH